MRRSLLGLVLAFGALAAPAGAALRYASPGGGGTACTFAERCTLTTAVSGAAAGDEVIVGPGAYGSGSLVIEDPAAITLRGEFIGVRRPVIFGRVNLTHAGTKLRDLAISDTGSNRALYAAGATIDRVIALGSASSSGAGCIVSGSTVTNTVCKGGFNSEDGMTAFDSAIQHVTTLGYKFGVNAYGSSALRAVIARADATGPTGAKDVRVSDPGIALKDVAFNSIEGTPGSNTGQISAEPKFLDEANADYRQDPASPTVGKAQDIDGDVSASALDLNGNLRKIGDHTDIGAYEHVPSGPSFGATSLHDVTATSATLDAAITTNGGATETTLYYGVSPGPRSAGPTVYTLGSATPVTVALPFTGLTPATTYSYTVSAGSEGGTTSLFPATFTTPPEPPTATTGDATNVTATSATLNGTVDIKQALTGEARFVIGTDETPRQTVTASGAVTTTVNNLAPATTYAYKTRIKTAGGMAEGPVRQFTTAAGPPSAFLPAPPAAEAEPNGTPATATPITSGSRVRGRVLPGDVDLYKFTAHATDRVYAATMTSGSGGGGNSVLRLLGGPDGTTPLQTDDNHGSQNADASTIAGTTLPADGTYYLEVRDAAGDGSLLPYDLALQLQEHSLTSEAEPNNGRATATPLEGGDYAGKRDPAGDPDYFSIDLQAGDTLIAILDLDPERDGSPGNARLSVGGFGDAEDRFAIADDAGVADPVGGSTAQSEAYAVTVRRSGTYYVRVDQAASSGGPTATYQLSTTVIGGQLAAGCRRYPLAAGGAIPDPGLATFDFTVADVARVRRAALALDVTHPAPGDLDVTLQAPGGDEVLMLAHAGSANGVPDPQTRMDVLLDDAAAAPLVPDGPTRPLAAQPAARGHLALFTGVATAGTWRLRVRDDQQPAGGTLNGATLILCAEDAPPAEVAIAAYDFDSGDGGFTHSGTKDEWERGTPATVPGAGIAEDVAALSACAAGPGCFKTDLDGTYEAGSSQDLVSPPVAVPAAGRSFVAWEQWLQLETAAFDDARVSVEEADGANPTPLFDHDEGFMGGFVGPARLGWGAGWSRRRAEITSYAGKQVRLRFHLDADDTPSSNYAGLAVDNVRFTRPAYSLTVTKAGTGAGTVTSAPAGIDCGPTCTAAFGEEQAVTLSAAAAGTSEFTGWSGAGCSGTGACSVAIGAAETVTATFALKPTASATPTATVTARPTPTPAPVVPKPVLKARATRRAITLTLSCGGLACTAKPKVRADKDKIAPRLVAAALLGSRKLPARGRVKLKLPWLAKVKRKLAKIDKPVTIKVAVRFGYGQPGPQTKRARAKVR